MKTIVAITSQNKKTITKHAGQCRNFLIYTIQGNEISNKTILELRQDETLKYTFHEDTSQNPKNVIFDADILLTGSIGEGGINRLAKQNVTAYIVEEKNPEIAVQRLIKGTLEAIAPVSHNHGGCSHNH